MGGIVDDGLSLLTDVAVIPVPLIIVIVGTQERRFLVMVFCSFHRLVYGPGNSAQAVARNRAYLSRPRPANRGWYSSRSS